MEKKKNLITFLKNMLILNRFNSHLIEIMFRCSVFYLIILRLHYNCIKMYFLKIAC